MDEKRIEQVLEIENQAQAIHEAAQREAEQLPKQAEKEAQALIEKARSEAEEEARRIVDHAQAEDESARILAQAAENARSTEALAMSNLDRGVAYVLTHVIGRE
jgi:V/A-type H+-transporting ATPase subunit G/H